MDIEQQIETLRVDASLSSIARRALAVIDYQQVIISQQAAEIERLKSMLPKPKRKCMSCNGSGIYDSHGSPPCGACDGTGEVES